MRNRLIGGALEEPAVWQGRPLETIDGGSSEASLGEFIHSKR
jgi:hypothetical protein